MLGAYFLEIPDQVRNDSEKQLCMSQTITRIITDIVLLLCVFFAPWWITLLLGSVAAFFFRSFIEIIIVGLLLDLLFGAPGVGTFSLPIIHTIITLVIYGVSVFIRARVR